MLVLLRHGETEFNRLGRFQGRIDTPLTNTGVQQAHIMGTKLKKLLRDRKFKLHSSPLGRALSTAQIIQSHFREETIVIDRRLAEIDIGDWSGMAIHEIHARDLPKSNGKSHDTWWLRAPRGERSEEFLGRLRLWLSEALLYEEAIIAVSHTWAVLGLISLYSSSEITTGMNYASDREAILVLKHGEIVQI